MIDDTEAGLELPPLEEVMTEEEKQEALSQDESLKVEFDQAVKAQAEQRAQTPFFAAAQTHAMIWNGFADSLRDVTSADLKRIILYLCGYPFYMKELGVEERKKNVIGVAYRASKLVEAKSAMILCKAIEQEARVAKALDEQEALIQPLDPANFVQENTAESADSTVEIKPESPSES
jgi:hypothetical protein